MALIAHGYILILILASCWILLSNGYVIDYENADVTLHNGTVTWSTAQSLCDASSSFLYLIENDPNIIDDIAKLKRRSHFRFNTSAWIGNYVTYDVNSKSVSQSSTVTFSTSKSSRTSGKHPCTSSSSLWSPPMSFTSTASNNNIGNGNFSGNTHNGRLVNHEFWIYGYISISSSHTPADGTKYQCGYLEATGSNIKYDDCNKEKSYLCITSILVSNEADVPKRGKSFNRQKSENSVETNDNNRLTTYNQINIEDLREQSVHRLGGQDQPIAYSIEDSEDLAYAMYTPVIHKPKTLPHSSAPPKPSRFGSHPGYLTMDGKRSVNTEYDVLQSVGSVKSGRDIRETDIDYEANVYDTPKTGEQMDEHESFYDSTIIQHPSQKAFLNNDYDHIALNSDPEMNRSICNSTGSAKRPVPLPRSNPGYEKMNEIVKR
ncbi:hypothetical protein ACF0H5_009313 [Mactra antiquata]